jgi:hypothetical protein
VGIALRSHGQIGQNEMKDKGHLCHRISTGLFHELLFQSKQYAKF